MLFQAYFHQDYDLDHSDDPMGGWRDFAATQDRQAQLQVIAEIDRFLLNHPADALSAFHDIMKPDYVFADSDGSLRAWLRAGSLILSA